MAITIVNNGASIQITDGTQIRNVTKAHIVEVVVIKTTLVKINIGLGALHNIFIDYSNVTSPVTGSADALRDAINTMLAPDTGGTGGGGTGGTGASTEARQIEEIAQLTLIKTGVYNSSSFLNSLDNKVSAQPIRIENAEDGSVYMGWADPASPESAAVWAIQRIQQVGTVQVYMWALGTKNFDKVWNDRASFIYI